MKTHVPFTLEMNSNYMKWVSYFKVLCGKFGLRPHIDAPGTAFPDDPQWVIADSCVKSWLFGSVGDSVLDLALAGDDQTARQLWVAIEEIFTANQEPRYSPDSGSTSRSSTRERRPKSRVGDDQGRRPNSSWFTSRFTTGAHTAGLPVERR